MIELQEGEVIIVSGQAYSINMPENRIVYSVDPNTVTIWENKDEKPTFVFHGFPFILTKKEIAKSLAAVF